MVLSPGQPHHHHKSARFVTVFATNPLITRRQLIGCRSFQSRPRVLAKAQGLQGPGLDMNIRGFLWLQAPLYSLELIAFVSV